MGAPSCRPRSARLPDDLLDDVLGQCSPRGPLSTNERDLGRVPAGAPHVTSLNSTMIDRYVASHLTPRRRSGRAGRAQLGAIHPRGCSDVGRESSQQQLPVVHPVVCAGKQRGDKRQIGLHQPHGVVWEVLNAGSYLSCVGRTAQSSLRYLMLTDVRPGWQSPPPFAVDVGWLRRWDGRSGGCDGRCGRSGRMFGLGFWGGWTASGFGE